MIRWDAQIIENFKLREARCMDMRLILVRRM